MQRILLTGFAPFLSHASNPTAALVQGLDGTVYAGVRLYGAVLPVAYESSAEACFQAMERVRPDGVLMFGLAYREDVVRVERLALNLDDAEAADNQGVVRRNRPIRAGGPLGHWSGLPVDLLVDGLNRAGLPARPSRDAGGYVCNHLFFQVRQRLAEQGRAIPAGFIHLPPTPDLIREEERPHRPGWPMPRLQQVAATVLALLTGHSRTEPA